MYISDQGEKPWTIAKYELRSGVYDLGFQAKQSRGYAIGIGYGIRRANCCILLLKRRGGHHRPRYNMSYIKFA